MFSRKMTMPLMARSGTMFTAATGATRHYAQAFSQVCPAPHQNGTTLHMSSNADEFMSTLLMKSSADWNVAEAPTGSAGQDRVLHNMNLAENPYQASCMEIRMPTKKKTIQVRKRSLNFEALRRRREQVAGNSAESCYRTSHDVAKDEAEVVFYYETSTDKGLEGFQYIAGQVEEKVLPGRCENATGVAGFAIWIVSRREYLDLMKSRPQIEMTSDCDGVILESEVELEETGADEAK